MTEDKHLEKVWDEAISELFHGDMKNWKENFKLALSMSPTNIEACKDNYKLRIVDEQME